MAASRILALYLQREVLLYTGLGLFAISIILVSQNLLRMLEDLIAVGFTFHDFAVVTRCVVTMLLAYALPLAFLFGALLGIGRMAAQNEITAMHACGLGLRDLVLPMLVLGGAVTLVTGYWILDVEHRARRELRDQAVIMAGRGVAIEPGQFRRIGPRVLYVRNRDRQDRLEGVLIADGSDPQHPFMIFAEHGRLAWDPERGELRFRLHNGGIHLEALDDGNGYRRISFRDFDYGFRLREILDVDFAHVRPKEMTLEELRTVVARAREGESLDRLLEKDPTHYLLQIHRRFALPAAPLVFAVVAVALALRGRRGARSWGVIQCALIAFGYYALLSVGESLALEDLLPAALAVWMPNAVFGLLALVWLRRRRGPGR